MKIHIGPGFYVLPFPLCHLPGRVFLPAAFGIAGQFPGSGLCGQLGFMGSFHTHIFMLDLVYLVVDIEPCFCTAPRTAFFASPGGFFAARFASVLSSFSWAFPSFPPACSAFACAFWYLSFLLPVFSAEPPAPVPCRYPAARPLHLPASCGQRDGFCGCPLETCRFWTSGHRGPKDCPARYPRPQTAGVGMVRGKALPVQPVRGDCPRYPPLAPAFENSVCPVSFR